MVEYGYATDAGVLHRRSDGIKHYTTSHGLKDQIIYTVVCNNGTLFAGSHEAGVYQLDKIADRFVELTPEWSFGPIRQIIQTRNQTFWLRTEQNGVLHFYPENQFIQSVKGHLASNISNAPLALLIDRAGMAWMGDEEKSLTKISQHFEIYRPHNIPEMQALISLSSSELGIGTNKGFFLFDEHSGEVDRISNTEGYNVVCLDKIENVVLAGTFDEGLFCVGLGNKMVTALDNIYDLRNNSIISMDHSESELWLSTLGGIYRANYFIDRGKIQLTDLKKFDYLTNNYVYDIEMGDDGEVYFATDGDGLAQWKNGKLTYFRDSTDHNAQLYTVLQREDAVWVLESDKGLCALDRSGQKIDCRSLQSNVEISGMLMCQSGDLYVFQSNGINQVNAIDHSSILYGPENGLIDFIPQLNATCSKEEGHLFVAAQDQIIRIDPEYKVVSRPYVYIDGIQAGDRMLNPDKRHELSPDEHTVLFRLLGVYYPHRESISFHYRLDGHDADWITTKDENIIYSKLSAGDYSFRVKAISSNIIGQKSPETAFHFTILPPVWKRAWFLTCCTACFGLLLYLFVEFRERQITRKKELERVNLEPPVRSAKKAIKPSLLVQCL